MAKIEAKSGSTEAGVSGRAAARRGSKGQARQGVTGRGIARPGDAGMVSRVETRPDEQPHDMAGSTGLDRTRPGTARLGRHGETGPDGATQDRAAPASEKKKAKVQITPPNFEEIVLHVVGTAGYVQHAFSQKALLQIEETHRAGSQSRTRKKREARDFEADYENAKHKSTEGWLGIPAPAFRNALISACKIVSFFQTRAKLALFIIADGMDAVDGTPMVKIIGEPEIHKGWGRNESGTVDLRWRPIWHKWAADVRIRYDADMFSASDIVHLMMRAGLQVGVGEGRPDSPNSNGMGWGTFEVVS